MPLTTTLSAAFSMLVTLAVMLCYLSSIKRKAQKNLDKQDSNLDLCDADATSTSQVIRPTRSWSLCGSMICP